MPLLELERLEDLLPEDLELLPEELLLELLDLTEPELRLLELDEEGLL